MLEKPQISDTLISATMRQDYGLQVNRVTFLPLGYDTHTAVYQLESGNGTAYFLKLRKGAFNPVAVSLPQYLCQHGIGVIISPLATIDGALYGKLEQYTAVLYPFISGKDGYQVKLNQQQWISLGQAMRKIHTIHLPGELSREISTEVYSPHWRESTREFLAELGRVTYTDLIAQQFSAFMKSKSEEISHMVQRAEALAACLHGQTEQFVLCHSDAHPGNFLVADSGEVYLVDWDNPVFAPREHDLMCIGSGMSGMQPGGQEEAWFYEGYGQVEIDWQALAYYRYERVIQDIAEFCKQILVSKSGGEHRAQSLHYFMGSFSTGAEVDVARETDRTASHWMDRRC